MLTLRLWLSSLLIGGLALAALASPPAWWAQRGATNAQPADDYAAANLGQLKHIATQAAAELNALLPGGAGSDINTLLRGWDPANSNATRDDFAALNQGQLKTVAALYYARLVSFGYAGQPLTGGQNLPWTAGTGDDDAYSLVNLGQLKYVFSFNPAPVLDTDSDGLLDSWELTNFTTLTAYTGSGDADLDGLNNRIELLLGTKPNANFQAASSASLGFAVYSPN